MSSKSYTHIIRLDVLERIWESPINTLPPVHKFGKWYSIDAHYLGKRYSKKSKDINLIIEDFIAFINKNHNEHDKNKSRELLPVGAES